MEASPSPTTVDVNNDENEQPAGGILYAFLIGDVASEEGASATNCLFVIAKFHRSAKRCV